MTLSKEERSRIGKRSKGKGSEFERKIARMLTTHFKGTPRAEVFQKTPASGGLRWKNNSDVIGDLITPPDFIFTIECKKREDLDYEVLFSTRSKNKSEDLINFYSQACDEAVRANRQPLLIVEKRQGKPIAILPQAVFRSIVSDTNKECCILGTIKVTQENGAWQSVVLLPFKELLEMVLFEKWFVKENA
jgi:Holliday junction resolvase